jgi:nicotinamide-nucleotide amidase
VAPTGTSVELITIGEELLLGFTIDTNGAFIARELAAVGVSITRRTSVGDDGSAIASAVREALERTGAVITTGGLGPTSDDMTKPHIAAVFGRGMRRDEAILEALRERWKARGWGGSLPRTNEQQADVPDGATILTNRHGSAPGIWLEDARGWVAMLPGVPREMRGMFAEELLPRVRDRLAATGAATVVLSRTVRTTSIAESALADLITPIAERLKGVTLAYLPHWPGVDLRVTARGDAAEAERAVTAAVATLREVVGAHAYGEGADDLAAVVLDLCRAQGAQVAVAESCTGGLLGGRITAISGSSDLFRGGVIAYHNAVKVADLGVAEATLAAHGAVSVETAREMAMGVRARFGCDVGVSITGIAGPGGGSAEKPVGTVCCGVDIRGEVVAHRRQMVGDREEVRQRSTQWALDLVRRGLTGALSKRPT